MKRWVKIIYVLVFAVMQMQVLIAQNALKVVDSKTQQPVYLVNAKFTKINQPNQGEVRWATSNHQGNINIPVNDSAKVELTCIGYAPKHLYISSKKNITIAIDENLLELNEQVITANFVPIEKTESTYNIKTINEETILEKGATNLREVLNTELGFKTNNGHTNETSINLNGLSGNHVKFMIDGVPVEGRLEGNIDLSQINTNDVEKIEIIDGPASVAYGTNAIGGTINIITKKKQTQKISGSFKSYYETIGQYNFTGSLGVRVKENTFKISGGRNFFNGYASPDTSRFKTWKPREQYFASLLYNRRIKALSLSYISEGFAETMTSRGLPLAPYFISAFDTYYFTNRFNNKLLLSGRVKGNHFLDFTLAQSHYNRIRTIYFKDLTTLEKFLTTSSDQDTVQFNNYIFRGVYSRYNDTAVFNYSIGAEFKQDYITAQRILNRKQNINDYALFTSIDFKPIKDLTIKPAARYAYNTKYKAPLIPSVNLLYKINNALSLRASVAKGFRAPDLKELYLEFHYSSSINLWGNTQLKAENSTNYNVSLDIAKTINQHQIVITPKAYYSKISNLIGLVQFSPVDWQYTNINYFSTKGGALTMSYVYNRIALTSGINSYGQYNSAFDRVGFKNKFFYTNDANASVSYKLDSIGLSFNFLYKYNGLIRNYYLTKLNEIKESYIGNYNTMDVSITKHFIKQRINVTTGVKNILNTKSVVMAGDVFGVSNQSNATTLSVLWGRTYFISLSINL